MGSDRNNKINVANTEKTGTRVLRSVVLHLQPL